MKKPRIQAVQVLKLFTDCITRAPNMKETHSCFLVKDHTDKGLNLYFSQFKDKYYYTYSVYFKAVNHVVILF